MPVSFCCAFTNVLLQLVEPVTLKQRNAEEKILRDTLNAVQGILTEGKATRTEPQRGTYWRTGKPYPAALLPHIENEAANVVVRVSATALACLSVCAWSCSAAGRRGRGA